MQTICRCYLSEQLSILGWLFVTRLYYNLSLPYRVNVFQQGQYSQWEALQLSHAMVAIGRFNAHNQYKQLAHKTKVSLRTFEEIIVWLHQSS
jgi:hypothetical protein